MSKNQTVTANTTQPPKEEWCVVYVTLCVRTRALCVEMSILIVDGNSSFEGDHKRLGVGCTFVVVCPRNRLRLSSILAQNQG